MKAKKQLGAIRGMKQSKQVNAQAKTSIFENQTTLLSCEQLAEKLGISVKAIRRRVERRTIPYLKAGKSLRFSVEEVEKWLTHEAGAKNVS